jgi:hypothetical protein
MTRRPDLEREGAAFARRGRRRPPQGVVEAFAHETQARQVEEPPIQLHRDGHEGAPAEEEDHVAEGAAQRARRLEEDRERRHQRERREGEQDERQQERTDIQPPLLPAVSWRARPPAKGSAASAASMQKLLSALPPA